MRMKNRSNASDPAEDNPAVLKKQIEELRKSEEFFRTIMQNSSDVIIVVNPKAVITYVNPSIEQCLGYKPEELIGKSGFNYIVPSELPRALLDFGKAILTQDINLHNSFGVKHKDGSTRIMGGIGINLLHNPVVKGFVINAHDITDQRLAEADLDSHQKHLERLVETRTAEISRINARLSDELAERKEMEKALKESEERHRNFIENIPIGVTIIDLAGKVRYMNKRLQEMLGWSPKDLIGKDAFSLEVFDDPTRKLLSGHFTAGAGADRQRFADIPLTARNKTRLWVDMIATRLKKDGESVGMQMVFIDMTERKQAEAERKGLIGRLHRAEKMEALGNMAGGVAHDLNNVLGVLVGYTELMMMKMPEEYPFKKLLHNIMQSSEKATAILQDMLTLAGRGVTVSEVLNLNNVLSECFRTPEFERLRSFYPRVVFKQKLTEDLLNIQGSPVLLQKIVMNLIANAMEAISGKGEVHVSTGNSYLDKPVPGYDDVREGDYVVLTVRDSGKGIPAAEIDKIFEPFYTKKVKGRSGTGLGLSIVWGTVKDHQGYIDVQSEPGKGSIFTIYLPATRAALKQLREEPSGHSFKGKGESVLVVDDLQEQREVAESLLTRLGYNVNTASSGEEAVAYLKKNQADVLILDMLMEPGIDGLETYQRILKINPKQKAIIVSGYTETDRVKQVLELGASSFIRKPYLIDNIGTAIRKALSKP